MYQNTQFYVWGVLDPNAFAASPSLALGFKPNLLSLGTAVLYDVRNVRNHLIAWETPVVTMTTSWREVSARRNDRLSTRAPSA